MDNNTNTNLLQILLDGQRETKALVVELKKDVREDISQLRQELRSEIHVVDTRQDLHEQRTTKIEDRVLVLEEVKKKYDADAPLIDTFRRWMTSFRSTILLCVILVVILIICIEGITLKSDTFSNRFLQNFSQNAAKPAADTATNYINGNNSKIKLE
jgi:uncharacterized membrane protein affecting hemolysin expression